MKPDKNNIEKGREVLNRLEKAISDKNIKEVLNINEEISKSDWWSKVPIYIESEFNKLMDKAELI